MKRFEFDYTIDNYRERLNRVSQYVNELTMEEYEELQGKTEYVGKIGEYVLFAYDKEIKKQRDSLTPAQHRVLKGKAKGINTNVDNRRQRTKYKWEKIPMSEENIERIWKCKDDIELILNQIKVYKKMLENPNLNSKQKEYGTDIYLLADEPYRELVFTGEEVPYIPKYYDNTIVCYSYSKALSLPGERIGYIFYGCRFSCCE
jgi:hypothetical protein